MRHKLMLVFICLTILFWKPFPGYAAGFRFDQKNKHEIIIGNKAIRFGFNATTGALLTFSDLTNSTELLNYRNASENSLWEITLIRNAATRKLNLSNAQSFHYSKVNDKTLQLEWNDFTGLSNPSLKVMVTVKVADNELFSEWHIAIEGLNGEKIERVAFPRISGFENIENEKLAVPQWMGELMKDPFPKKAKENGSGKQYVWNYPGPLSMQFVALYNRGPQGLYFAANDTMNYFKQLSMGVDSAGYIGYQMNNYPAFDSSLGNYVLPYDATIGIFKGDWFSAAMIYKKWAVNQKWCRESRLKNNNDNSWLDSTALWVWNRGESNNVLTPAEELKKKLQLPVNVLWHWWHGCAYDDGFPDYFPPREGPESFKHAVNLANAEGVNAILYMNSFQWGTSTKSFETESAAKWAVRNINGNMEPHVFNIFTHHSLTPMCMATGFWRNKYSSLADKAINRYHVGGIYMDQACISYMCYNKDHGHSIGGGDYWVNSFGLLTNEIRKNNSSNKKIVLAGEGCGEGWLPYLNAFLTLQVSNERYAGVDGPQTIPLFQAVYHQYGVTFGNYSSLVSPPYDALWPKEYAPKHPEELLDPKFNKQFLMEQARSFVWGMQPTMANYHEFLSTKRGVEINYLVDLVKVRYKALKYLLYGEFIRPPQIEIPEEVIPISRLSIYAGQKDRVKTFQENIPLLYTSAWKANDGSLGIAIAGINSTPSQIKFSMDSISYNIGKSGKIYMITAEGEKLLTIYKNGNSHINFKLSPDGICFLKIIPDF